MLRAPAWGRRETDRSKTLQGLVFNCVVLVHDLAQIRGTTGRGKDQLLAAVLQTLLQDPWSHDFMKGR